MNTFDDDQFTTGDPMNPQQSTTDGLIEDRDIPGATPVKKGQPPAITEGMKVTQPTGGAPVIPEEPVEVVAERNAQERIARERQQVAAKNARKNPFHGLGRRPSGRMARLRAFSMDPSAMSGEAGAAIEKAFDTLRGDSDKELTASELQLALEATKRRGNLTTQTKELQKSRKHLEGVAQAQMQAGLNKLRAGMANIQNIEQWNKRVDELSKPLTGGAFRMQAAEMLPTRLITKHNLEKANDPTYKKWLEQEGYSAPEIEDITRGKSDGGEGEALYQEFLGERVPGTWITSPDGKKTEVIKESPSAIKAREEAEAKRQARDKLISPHFSIEDIEYGDKAQRDVLLQNGATETAVEFMQDYAKERVQPSLTGEAVIKTAGATTLGNAINIASELYTKGDADKAIKKAIGQLIEDGDIEGVSSEEAFAILGEQIREGMKSRFQTDISGAQEKAKQSFGDKLASFNESLIESGKAIDTMSNAEQQALSLELGVTSMESIDAAAEKYIRDTFPGLDADMDKYLRDGIMLSQESTTRANKEYQPVNDLYKKVKRTLETGYMQDVRRKELALENERRRTFQEKVEREQEKILKQEQEIQESADARDEVINVLDSGMGWRALPEGPNHIAAAFEAIPAKLQGPIQAKILRGEPLEGDELQAAQESGLFIAMQRRQSKPGNYVQMRTLDIDDQLELLDGMERSLNSKTLKLLPEDRKAAIMRVQKERQAIIKEVDEADEVLKEEVRKMQELHEQIFSNLEEEE